MFPMHGGFMGRKKGGCPPLPYRALLDEYPTNCTGAWFTYRVSTSYVGPCMSVAVFGGPSVDIGFTCTGELDTAAIIATSGGLEVRVRVWYDQSGLNRDFDASSAAFGSQPIIYTGAAFYNINSQVSLFLDTSCNFSVVGLNLYNHLHNGTGSTIALVSQFSNTAASGIFALQLATARSSTQVGYSLGVADNSPNLSKAYTNIPRGGGAVAVNSIGANNSAILGAQALTFDVVDADNATLANRSRKYINNGALIAVNTSNGVVSTANHTFNLSLANTAGFVTNRDDQYVQGLIIYNIDQEANRSDIQDIINEMYNVF